MTMRWAVLMTALVMLGTFGRAGADSAQADDVVDCGSTPFAFSGQGYLVDCEQHEVQARKNGGSGASRLDVMTVTSEERSVFLTMISVRLTSTNLFMRYQGLRDNALYYFNGVEMKDWSGTGDKAGYDTAEFDAEISGQPSRCVAVQRYLNPAFGGFQRHVLGVGCASGDISAVYGALDQLRAPGD